MKECMCTVRHEEDVLYSHKQLFVYPPPTPHMDIPTTHVVVGIGGIPTLLLLFLVLLGKTYLGESHFLRITQVALRIYMA